MKHTYTRVVWKNGTGKALNDTNLNQMDIGIQNAFEMIGTNETNITKNTSDITALQTDVGQKAAKATTLEGYGITNAYNKTEVENYVAKQLEGYTPTGGTGTPGKDGEDGEDGIGIVSIVDTTPTTADGGEHKIKITLSGTPEGASSNVQTLSIYNGQKGATGPSGRDGTTPTITINQNGYWVINGVTQTTKAVGVDGTGVTILGSYNSESELNNAHATGNNGDAYMVGGYLYVWSSSENKWKNVGPIQGATGPTGATGPQGLRGATGANGEKGAKGDDGDKGDKGDTGATGPQGPAGATGVTGATGPKGSTGPTGATGPRGATGPQGPTGATGPQGPKGNDGAGVNIKGSQAECLVAGDAYVDDTTGHIMIRRDDGSFKDGGEIKGPAGATGATGPKGATGAEGPIGATGAKGNTGATGATGAKGSTGSTGPTGATGPKGSTGPQGATGATGPKGGDGEKGDKGDTGATGAKGNTGATGPQGPAGATGPKGSTGATGPQGATGPKGPQGATGPTGPQGATGPQGPTGATGSVASVGATGSGNAVTNVSLNTSTRVLTVTKDATYTTSDDVETLINNATITARHVQVDEFKESADAEVSSAPLNAVVDITCSRLEKLEGRLTWQSF